VSAGRAGRAGWLALIGAAAAVTVWVAQSPPDEDGGGAAPGEAATFYLREAQLAETGPDGRWQVQVEADSARESAPGSRLVELTGVRALYHPGGDDAWRLSADRGELPPGGQKLALAGAVRLTPAEGTRRFGPVVTTPTLEVDLVREVASTAAAVRIDFGRHALLARGMEADMRAGTLRLESELHGTFTP